MPTKCLQAVQMLKKLQAAFGRVLLLVRIWKPVESVDKSAKLDVCDVATDDVLLEARNLSTQPGQLSHHHARQVISKH